MDLSVKKLAVGAVRLAAMSQLGPLAGGLFLAGGAVAGKILAESEWAKASAEMLMHLASDKASELFGSAAEGFRGLRNSDLEKSMLQAARMALDDLRKDAPQGFDDWFDDWRRFLTMRPAAEVFAGARDIDIVALEYDDDRFRKLWWSRMEPVLVGWRKTEKSSITQIGLSGGDTLPGPLAEFLRDRLPEAMQAAHEEVLRDEKLKRSWIGFQQHVYHDTLNHLSEIRSQLDRIEEIVANLQGPGQATAIWSIPLPTQHFQDRPELIGQIDAALDRSSVTALTALHGLGGIGKTQMARKFAELRRERYELGVWIESESEASLLASFAAVSRLMEWPPEQDQQALAARVINEISTREPYLVIFDNAESLEALRPWVEKLSGLGHVLITSRNQNWDGFAQAVSVTQWSVPESARFLLERTQQTDRGAAEDLARDLDGLVLALEHAAAYMLAGDGVTLAEYRRAWREKLKWYAPEGHAYPDSVAAALGLSLDAVATKSPEAYDLLCLFAWLAPDRIPRKELLEAGAGKLPEALAKAFADRDEWTGVTEKLGRYSLLTRERVAGVTTGYLVHRVVQQVLRERLAADGAGAQWLAAACDLVDAAFPFDSDEPGFWPACEALLPHARAIREHVRLLGSPASLGRMLNQTGVYLRVRGLYKEARDFQDLALKSDLRQFGPDHPTVAVDRSNLANILGALGEHAEARKQIELALESALRQFGPDHPNVALRRSNLANILGALGEHAEARKQIELALESDLRLFGPDHPNVAAHRSNLASILGDLGEHAEARKQIELALESALRQLGPDHPNVAVRRSNLANILGDLGEHAEARKKIELALESDLRQFEPDHPNVAVDRSNLATILYHLGEYQAALREIELALEIFRKKLPPGHPHIRHAERWREIILKAGGAAGTGSATS